MNEDVKLDRKENPTAEVYALSHDGRGIANVNNKTTFIKGALPQETVTFKFTQKRSNFNEAEMLDILTPSSLRQTPPCQHFGLCGGCSLQHMADQTQIEFKQKTLLEQLKHFGKVEPKHILAPLHAQSTGYRRKARLGVKYVIKKNKLLIGFREKSSRYLADLEGCEVLHPKVGKQFGILSELISSLTAFQHIPQIEIAIGDEEAALVFRHLEPLTPADQEKLMAFGKTHGFHIYLQPTPPLPVQKVWPQDDNSRLSYTLPDEQLEFLFHPLDFTQINLEMNRLMVKQAMELLDVQPDETVLDLFCGIGNFTLPIARRAKHVVGVEGSQEMVERGFANAAHNQLSNVAFYAANLETPNEQAPWLKTTYDKILLDPPRVGAIGILPAISTLKAKRLVYVSCNPATLARDAGELVHQYGYQLTAAGMMNMFPHTSHIEAMAVFDKI